VNETAYVVLVECSIKPAMVVRLKGYCGSVKNNRLEAHAGQGSSRWLPWARQIPWTPNMICWFPCTSIIRHFLCSLRRGPSTQAAASNSGQSWLPAPSGICDSAAKMKDS